MGRLFRFISDAIAQTAVAGVCESCKQTHPLFPIHADIDNDEWTYSSDEVDSLCASCIRRLPLRNFAWRDSERHVQQIVNSQFPKGTLRGAERQCKLVSICDEFRRTPTFPLFLQNEDWPFCCGTFCEYWYIHANTDKQTEGAQ